MIGQMKTLLRVKDLKQDQAFRELQRARGQVAEAERARAEAQETVDVSASTLLSREDAVFATVIGRVVDLGEIDMVHGDVARIQKGHRELEDDRDRALHVEARLRTQMEACGQIYQAAVKVRDKYGMITQELVSVRLAEMEAREEIEVEDMFSRPGRRPA